MNQFHIVENSGVAWPRGFQVAGIKAGIKASNKHDLAIIISDEDVRTFGAFTQNQVVAAPVVLSQKLLGENSMTRGCLINSGNANACTGTLGMENAQELVQLTENFFDLEAGSILICHTGIIGVQLPMETIKNALPQLKNQLSKDTDTVDASGLFAEAILTTDTCRKEIAVKIDTDLGEIRIAGASKGSGMIHPNMATMLAFVTTDIELSADFQTEFKAIVDDSFNSITVDGDTSTNDTALLMSSKGTGIKYEDLSLAEQGEFRKAIFYVFADLAQKIIRDGEGATKFVEIKVRQARSRQEARLIARYVANSKLVKTALFGNDPNWGRIIAAIGNTGVPIHPEKISIKYDDAYVLMAGEPASTPTDKLEAIALKNEFVIDISLDLGDASTSIWTSDLSYEYVRINAEYST